MNSTSPLAPRRSLPRLAVVLALCGSLAACYVLPIDARTGQPYPPPSHDGYAGSASSLPVVAAVAAAPALVDVRLYLLNTQANKGGLLKAQVLEQQRRPRLVRRLLPRRHAVQGESTRVDATTAAPFGRIYQQVLGLSLRSFSGRRGDRQRVRRQGHQRAMRVRSDRTHGRNRRLPVLRRCRVPDALRRLSARSAPGGLARPSVSRAAAASRPTSRDAGQRRCTRRPRRGRPRRPRGKCPVEARAAAWPLRSAISW